MNTGPRYARRTDNNHAELRQAIKDCAKAFPQMHIAWLDTSNVGGKMGDGIIQYWDVSSRWRRFHTHLLEFKSSKKAKLTDSQETNPLQLIRIDCVDDIYDLLQVTWRD